MTYLVGAILAVQVIGLLVLVGIWSDLSLVGNSVCSELNDIYNKLAGNDEEPE